MLRSTDIGTCFMSSFATRLSDTPVARRALVAAAALVVVAVVLVFIGRSERDHWADQQLAGLARVRAAVGPLDQPSLSGYRVNPSYDCLLYRRGRNLPALELCVDKVGRLVQAVDRRTARHRFYSLTPQPELSTIHVSRAQVDRLLRRMGAR
jgi:hypothetical protein